MIIENARISIYPTKEDVTIEIFDWNSDCATPFVKVIMKPEEFSQAVGRCTSKCVIDVKNLNIVGKKVEFKPFEFKLPDETKNMYSGLEKIATKIANEKCPEGWEPDNFYNSQNSFFTKKVNNNTEQWARTTIRRWV